MRNAVAALAVILAGVAGRGELVWELSDQGVVSLADGRPLARAVLGMHGPDWAGMSTERDASARRQGDRVAGELDLGPARCQGVMAYGVAAAGEGAGVRVVANASFSAPNDIFGAYVSFFLPCSRFEGRPAVLLPANLRHSLPQADGQGFGATASAVAVDLGDGKALVLAANAAATVLVQDNRRYGSDQYEIRFGLFGRGRVGPGMQAQRTFALEVVPWDGVDGLVAAMAPLPRLDPEQPFALLRDRGEISIGTRHSRMVGIALAVHGVGWSYASQSAAEAQISRDSRTAFVAGVLPIPGAETRRLEFTQTVMALDGGNLGLRYRLHVPEAVRLNGYQVSFSLALPHFAESTLRLDAAADVRDLVIPSAHGENALHRGPVQRLAVAPERPHGFVLELDQPTDLLVQDNRGWGSSEIELRFHFRRQETGVDVPAGETVEREFTLRPNAPLQIVLDEAATPSQTDTTDWIPFSLPWDGAPVDVSFLNHKPAGRYGFVTAKGGRFILADTGEEIRFWGTCFSAGANFPTHEQAEAIARRLARFGINMVRTHHADAPWAEMHYFPKDADHTRTFDPVSMDRFDYLVHCLKREGIYIYLDQLVNRYFKAGDEVDAVSELEACAKPYSNFDPKLIALQKEFSQRLWTRVNPYTGLAYKDDPAIALTEFANENDLFSQQVVLEPYRSRFEARYRAWAARHGVILPDGAVDFQAKTDPMVRFLVEVQREFYLEMERFLRDEVGVRVPMTGSNWSRNAALLAALRDMAFTDSHVYWQHPARDGSVGNTPMVGGQGTIFRALAFQRLAGKPFFVSEWDQPWPNEWRAELPLWIAAISAFQEWNGLTVYTYRHSSKVPVDHIAGAFETFNDPARFGLFPHAALLYRRGDVAPGRLRVAVHLPEAAVLSAASPTPWGIPALRALPEMHRIESVLFAVPEGYDRVLGAAEAVAEPDDLRVADTGQIRRRIAHRVGCIDTDRTQAVFGFLQGAGVQTTADLTVDSTSLFATIAVSSLTSVPIRQSEHLLLTAVGRAENTGFRFNFTRTKRLADGTGPILIDPIRAEVALRTDHRDLVVRAVAADGSFLGEVPSRWKDGRLEFRLGPEARTMFYDLRAAP